MFLAKSARTVCALHCIGVKAAALSLMQNPFAIAVQWPDDPRRFLVHLQRPYFTAPLVETESAAWLLVSWAASPPDDAERERVFKNAADFCRTQLDQAHVPIRFVEKKHGHCLPRYLMAQTVARDLFIVEPDHTAPLVEVRDRDHLAGKTSRSKKVQRFDVITQWRLGEMRKYYQRILERQKAIASAGVPIGA